MFPGAAQQGGQPSSSMIDFQKFVSSGPGIPPELRALGNPREPTSEDMEKSMEAVRYNKTVLVKDVQVRTFDLSDEKQVEDYRKTYLELYKMVAESRVLIKDMEKKFISDDKGSRWLLHMEWIEYELKVTDHQMKKRETENGGRAPVQYRSGNGN